MIRFLLAFSFSLKYCWAVSGDPTKTVGLRPPSYLPFHPELVRPDATPPLDLLRDPDVGYSQNQGVKNFGKSLHLEGLLRNPLVALMPNVPGPRYSAYYLAEGLDSSFRGKPFSRNLARRASSSSVVVFDPSVRRRLFLFPVSNYTIVSARGVEVSPRSTRVPWLVFENFTVPETDRVGEKLVSGRLFHFFVFGDEDWDFFPENSVFDWTRPFPFAFAPPAPISDKETTPDPEVDASSPGTTSPETPTPEKSEASETKP